MKKIIVITMVLGASAISAAQAETCLSEKNLVALDAKYEQALQVGDTQFLDKLLAPEFYWVHNLASMKEKKTELLVRVKKSEEHAKKRRSYDISQQRLGNTVVLQGLSNVDKWNADGKTFRTSRYQFMRTYVEEKGECKLLAAQTMKVWSSDNK